MKCLISLRTKERDKSEINILQYFCRNLLKEGNGRRKDGINFDRTRLRNKRWQFERVRYGAR